MREVQPDINTCVRWAENISSILKCILRKFLNPYPANIFCPVNVICLLHLLHILKNAHQTT